MVNYICPVCGTIVASGFGPMPFNVVLCTGCTNLIYIDPKDRPDLKMKIEQCVSPEDLVYLLNDFDNYGESPDEEN